MTADKPSHLVPKLRFPKFEGAGDWEEKQLSSLVKLVSGVHLAPDMYSTTGEVPYFTGPSDFTDAIQCVAKWTAESVNIAKQHDTLITVKGSGVGKIWYLTLPSIAMGRQLMAVRTEVGDRRFIYQFLSTRRAQFEALASGNLIPGLSRGDILGMAAYFPSRDEQKKISDCLGSLDDLIAAEGRKLEALRQHKQGLMQQLFPQPGETQPRLRLPEFHNDPEWEEKELGDVSEVLMCKRIFASETNPNGGVPFYKIGTLGGVPDAFISKDLFEEYKSKYNFPRTGEVLITCSGTVGKCLPYDGSEAYFQDSNIVWIDNPTLEVSNEFLLSILSNVNWSTLNSTTITRIYGPDLRGLAIKFPQNEQEQKRIADCLSVLDDQIGVQARKRETLTRHKQGLLHQLFPSLEAESR